MKIIREIFRPYPHVLYLEPYFGCNFRCPFCIHGSGLVLEPAQLSPFVFEKLDPVIERVRHVHITGLGEPFLNPHLSAYLSYFRDKGKSYYINTNGSLIQDAHIDLMTTSQSELSVSLDAGDKETYAKVRSPTHWDRVIARVKHVSRIRAARGSPYPLLYLTFHINALNLPSLVKVPEIARELGIDAVKFSWTILPETHRSDSLFEHREAVEEIIRSVSIQLRRAGIQVTSEAFFTKHVRGCWDFSPMAFVGANGAVAACCHRWVTIGHLTENSFEDIWNGMPRRRIALAILNGKPEPECRDCSQIRGVDYERNEDDFLKPGDLESFILAEKTGNSAKLPSLDGLEVGFRFGVAALVRGELEAAVAVLSDLEEKFPDYFEIKNNLAAAYYHLGDSEKCKALLYSIAEIPHNETLSRLNLARALQE